MDHTDLIRAPPQTLIDHVDELTALDQAIGDGDHGLNMRRGALAIQAKLDDWPASRSTKRCAPMGMTCMSTIGGSSGPVFGTLLVTLAKELPAEPRRPTWVRRRRRRRRLVAWWRGGVVVVVVVVSGAAWWRGGVVSGEWWAVVGVVE